MSLLEAYLSKVSLSEEQEKKLIEYADFLLYQAQEKEDKIKSFPIQAYYSVADLEAIKAMYPVNKEWTYSEFMQAFPVTTQKMEIINKKLYIMPSPNRLHQKILRQLSIAFTLFTEKNDLGEVYFSPFDVKLDEENVVQPDILFIAKVHYDILTKQGASGTPDLVVEVLSPANYKAERERKKETYRKFGVTEYWEIQPKTQVVSVEILEENTYKLFSEAQEKGKVKSSILEGFEIEISTLFEE